MRGPLGGSAFFLGSDSYRSETRYALFPVSYTHLDVYKRQEQYLQLLTNNNWEITKIEQLDIIGDDGTGLIVSDSENDIVAVSYTHLPATATDITAKNLEVIPNNDIMVIVIANEPQSLTSKLNTVTSPSIQRKLG